MTHEVKLSSIIDSLSTKGFELDSEWRLSYHNPQNAFNVYIGKLSEKAMLETYRLPVCAFSKDSEGSSTLNLLVRKANVN